MNKQGPNGISWTDYTWNPVTGCKRGCFYCYAQNINRRFKDTSFNEITFYPKRLSLPEKVKKPSKIFVGSMCDLFADWTPKEWIYNILNVVAYNPHHIFQFLTKTPYGYHNRNFHFRSNCWLGVTVTGGEAKKHEYHKMYKNIMFISYEPLIGEIRYVPEYFNWIIIGAMTGNSFRKKYQPKEEWIKKILQQADRSRIPVFMKNNLRQSWKGKLRQEFPYA